MRHLIGLALVLGLGGCGDRLVDGSFLGDAAIRLHGSFAATVPTPRSPAVGAVWLGFSALFNRRSGVETRTLPISAIEFPAAFTCDLLGAPPNTGYYQTARGDIIPSSIRIARLLVFDDVDQNGGFALDDGGRVLPPDQLLSRSESHALLFVTQEAADPHSLDGRDMILNNWTEAFPGYHIIALDPSVASPNLAGRVVGNDTKVVFTPPVSEVNF